LITVVRSDPADVITGPVQADRVLQAVHFVRVQQAASAVQPGLVNGMQIGRIDIAELMAGETSVAFYRHMRTQRASRARDNGNRDSAQSGDQHIYGEDDHRVIASAGKVRLPYLPAQRLHDQ
jgi:hypothetical protein